MKNSNDTIGNRTRDLPACSAVSQPMRHRVPPSKVKFTLLPAIEGPEGSEVIDLLFL